MTSMNEVQEIEHPLQTLPGFLMRMASAKAVGGISKMLAQHNLRVAELSVLVYLAYNPGCLQRELGAALNILSANLTPLLSKLQDRRLIKRKPIDGRSNGLHLTAAGERLRAHAWKDVEAFENALLEQLPMRLRQPFVEALRILA